MTSKIYKLFAGVLALTAAAALVLRSDLAASGVQTGISLCLETVIPSLFAFMVLSDFLASGGGGGWLFAPFKGLARVYGLPSAAASALCLGVIGGYPVGARMAAGLKKEGALSASEASSLLCVAYGPSPTFLTGIGALVFGSRELGLVIWGCLLAANLPVGLLTARGLRRHGEKTVPVHPPVPLSQRFVDSVLSATRAMGVICGFTVAFAVLRQYLLLLPGDLGRWAAAFCEVSVGCMTAGEGNYRSALLLVTGCCSLGGVSVWMQNACFLRGSGISMKRFFLSRGLHLVLSLALILALDRIFSFSQWTAASVFSSFSEAVPAMGAGSAVSSVFLVISCLLLLQGGRGICYNTSD